ncbi:MAG: ATP-binding protein [Pseudomonadota bacterium]
MKSSLQASIHGRLLLAASLVLTAFLGVTGLALDKAYRSSSEEALMARLQTSIYAILAAAKEDEKGLLILPAVLTDPRFNLPDSGLYAEVKGPQIGFYWRSGSSVGRSLNFLRRVGPGESSYQLAGTTSAGGLMTLSFGVVWEDFMGREVEYVLAVAEDLQPYQEQIGTFRNTLFSWLGGAALLLLLAQGWVLRWGLRPLRSVVTELRNIESGQSGRLSGDYPRELQGLTQNINSLIRHAETRQQRYRDSLGDLAHSLKTPLAILQGLADQLRHGDEDQQQTLTEQVSRMNQIVSHQLQRAAASGRALLIKSLPVRPAVERIARSLSKVYLEKGIEWEISISRDAGFPGDEGDLMEVLGNLMDNAWKYGRSRVRVTGHTKNQALELHVEDDGEGIPPERMEEVLQRGRRLDEHQPGQGIGLAVAADIISAYGGRLTIEHSLLGGSDVAIIFYNNEL